MHIAFQRDRSTGRVSRTVRVMRGRRGDWLSSHLVVQGGLILYRDRAYLAGSGFFWRLPRSAMWSKLFDRWNVEKPCKPIKYSDRIECEHCGMMWNTDDLAPPTCRYERAHPVVRVLVWLLAGALGLGAWIGLLRALGM